MTSVSDSLNLIKQKVTEVGGYMVSSNLNKPEEGDTGTITVRVPADKLDSTLFFFKSLSIKVVSENLTGDDVNDQFVDNEGRLLILERNKARFEEIMVKAVTTDEILRVQQEVFTLQAQIDQIKGQQKYLEASAKTSLITVYLSTDELSLPFAPSQAWRPEIIVKHAVRSRVGTLRGLGSAAIWIGIYSVIWVPVILIIKVIRKRRRN